MENTRTIFYTISAVIGALLGEVTGGFDGFLYALTVLMVVDYISGVLVAIYNRQLSSSVGFNGIIKKIFIFGMVIVGNIVDVYILENGNAVRTAVIFFYLVNEAISITENSAKLGLPVPKKLIKILEQLEEEDSGDSQKNNSK